MVYIHTEHLTDRNREILLEWLVGEGLNPSEIAADDFSVHNGRISGWKFVLDREGNHLFDRKGRAIRHHFNRKHEVPFPEELI